MARIAQGEGDLDWARERLSQATTADELRQAQAILFPLELGMSLEETAIAIGRSVGHTCRLRNRRRREALGEIAARRNPRTLRNRALATLAEESAVLDALLPNADTGGVITIPSLLPAFEKALGRPIALSTLYRMLARHGWRKLAPDTQHPKGDPQRREDWKKNSRTRWVRQ